MKAFALRLTPAALAASLLVAGQAHAVGNGTVADGTGTISKNGTTTNVNQTSDKLIVNWDNMNVGSGETLNFNQKNAASAVLNRITSGSATSILGALNANGRVFVVNPNGVLIGSGAKINVGSLVASSLNISDDDFKADRLNFKGGGTGIVSNLGEINATESVAMIGPRVTNGGGKINSKGNVALAAGDAITLSFANSGLQATVTESSLKALINNAGIIITEDGDIALTAWARDSIARTVINNTGTIEARNLLGISSGSAKFESLGDGNVTLAGKTRGTTVTVKGKNVSLDGNVSAENLNVSADKAATTDRAQLQASYAKAT